MSSLIESFNMFVKVIIDNMESVYECDTVVLIDNNNEEIDLEMESDNKLIKSVPIQKIEKNMIFIMNNDGKTISKRTWRK